MAEDLFATQDPPTTEFNPETDYFSTLVGEGKKYRDQNALAYSRLENERFTERLKQENEAMRKDITAKARLEELVTKLSTVQPTTTTTQSPTNDNNQNNNRDVATVPSTAGLTPQQVDEIFEKRLNERNNYNRSVEGLKGIFGDDYQHKLDSEASKLGLGKEFVNNLAKTNPNAFLRLFEGAKQEDMNMFTPPPSSINTSAMKTPATTLNGVRTEKFYQELKQKDPVKYWSKEVQQQEYNDAIKLGEAYFNA